ncbi:MAG: hypothetical protein Q9O62_11155 [Ardenticatenia bacterium]|nr:hypothetical protein [Ardenticatenia bacterium]
MADLDAAIQAFQKALALAREGSPDWARWQANLGLALHTRFEALGQVADLDAAIQAFQRLPRPRRARAPPTGPPCRPTWAVALHTALRPWARWPTWTPPSKLPKALAPRPRGAPPAGPPWQANLGLALRTRFEALGQVADLDAAIQAFQKALALAREGSPDWATRQANLGGAFTPALRPWAGWPTWTPPSKPSKGPRPRPRGLPRLGHHAGQPGPGPPHPL